MGRWMQVLSKPPEPMDSTGVSPATVVAENDPSVIFSVRGVLTKSAREEFVMLCKVANFESYQDEDLFLSPEMVLSLTTEFERFLRICNHDEFSPVLTATHIQEHWSASPTDIDRTVDVLKRAALSQHWLRMML